MNRRALAVTLSVHAIGYSVLSVLAGWHGSDLVAIVSAAVGVVTFLVTLWVLLAWPDGS